MKRDAKREGFCEIKKIRKTFSSLFCEKVKKSKWIEDWWERGECMQKQK